MTVTTVTPKRNNLWYSHCGTAYLRSVLCASIRLLLLPSFKREGCRERLAQAHSAMLRLGSKTVPRGQVDADGVIGGETILVWLGHQMRKSLGGCYHSMPHIRQ